MTKISWANYTDNWIGGCSDVSRACVRCYAKVMSFRLPNLSPDAARIQKYKGTTVKRDGQPVKWSGLVNVSRDDMGSGLPKSKTKKGWCFVNSMSDTFHVDVPFENVEHYLIEFVQKYPNIVFIFLTKRPERMEEFTRWFRSRHHLNFDHFGELFCNTIWATTVEDQTQADTRIPHLIKVPGYRAISCEPLVGSLNLSHLCVENNRSQIHWIIAGGESGHGAEPSHPSWFLTLNKWAKRYNVPFHFKQWGSWKPADVPGPWESVTLTDSTSRKLIGIDGKDTGSWDHCGQDMVKIGGKDWSNLMGHGIIQDWPKIEPPEKP